MASTSSADLAGEILASCLEGKPWREEALSQLVDRARSDRTASSALFGILVEQLADRFEPRLCESYAALFSQVIEQVLPGRSRVATLERYRRVRNSARVDGDPSIVFVLSRITLGADVAVTSVVMDAAKRRFPGARIRFVGPRKNWELFEADPKIEFHALEYARSGALAERLQPTMLDGGLVLDPDSRITQLGLLPVCGERDYRFFESRAYGGDGAESMTDLTRRWTQQVLGVAGDPYVAPLPVNRRHDVTISLGVGENPEKRLNGEFESGVLRLLRGRDVLVDEGATEEEMERVRRAILRSGSSPAVWNGAYAPFACHISRSGLFIGYDSAGQHVAAACGVPLICIFAGSVSDRFFQRWQPTGPGPKRMIKVASRDSQAVLAELEQALAAW